MERENLSLFDEKHMQFFLSLSADNTSTASPGLTGGTYAIRTIPCRWGRTNERINE